MRPILFLTGIMLVALSAAMLLPAAADALAGSPNWQSFLIAGLITFAFGAGLSRWARCRLVAGLSLRQAFLLTPFAWTTLVLFGAIPLYISDYAQLKDSFTNAFFESMSGLTTTGGARALARTAADRGMRVAVPASLKTQLSRSTATRCRRLRIGSSSPSCTAHRRRAGLERTAHTDPSPTPPVGCAPGSRLPLPWTARSSPLAAPSSTTLQELDDRLGAPGAAAAVRVLVDQLEAVLPHLPERDHRRAVAALLSRAAALAGIQALDAGDPDSADARFVAAADAAAAAGVPALSVAPALGRAAALVEVGEAVAALAVLQHDGLEHVDPHHRAQLSPPRCGPRGGRPHRERPAPAVDIALPPAGLAVEHVADLHQRQVTPVPPTRCRSRGGSVLRPEPSARESNDPTSSSAAGRIQLAGYQTSAQVSQPTCAVQVADTNPHPLQREGLDLAAARRRRRRALAGVVQPRAVPVERRNELVHTLTAYRRAMGRPAHPSASSPVLISTAARGRGRSRGTVAVRLVHGEDVGDLEDPGLRGLDAVAHARCQQHDRGVGKRDDLHLRLPTPTVSTSTTSQPAASSTRSACGVDHASPPRRPRLAIDRMKTASSVACSPIRTRSPSRAPPENGDEIDRADQTVRAVAGPSPAPRSRSTPDAVVAV